MAKQAVVKTLPKTIKLAGVDVPTHASDRKFCTRWMVHKDHNLAAKESGMAASSIRQGAAKKKLLKYLPYLVQQLERREAAVAAQMALDQKDILNQMVAIGFANAQDYIKQAEVKDPATGKMKTVHVRKPLTELTRDQAAAVSNVLFMPDGTIQYSLPDEKSKHPYLKDLGQHLGLFHPKLIEQHRHAHLHRTLDFKGMDTDKLAEVEQKLIEAMGEEGRRMLGIIDGEFEEVQDELSRER